MPITIQDAGYTYAPGTPFERRALQKVSATIEEGSFTALAGRTGSGKSTFLQLLNGLLHPTEGRVLVDGIDLAPRKKAERPAAKKAARSVGMVFQYPEQQLFEETVERDIAFGPKQMGLSATEVSARVKESMDVLHLGEDLRERSPFALSGGQKRRVAIAGVLALRPKYLVLDEPTAGLDPRGRESLIETIRTLHDRWAMTIVFVSHNMDDILRLADRLLILGGGELLADGAPAALFRESETLLRAGLRAPALFTLIDAARAAGLAVDDAVTTEAAAVDALYRAVRGGEGSHAQ